jgi:hypothetical protein
MSTKPAGRIHLVIIGVGVVAILFQLASAVKFDGDGFVALAQIGGGGDHGDAGGDHVGTEPAAGAEPEIRLDSLTCFGCHDYAAFREGEDFPHVEHVEGGGVHCHVCHAFSGHAEVHTREDACEACH